MKIRAWRFRSWCLAPLVRGGLAASLALTASACGSVPSNHPDAGNDSSSEDAGIDAPAKECTSTTCTDNVLEVCGADGKVETSEQCALGCFSDDTRCKQVDPSNGLANYLDQAAQQSDVTLADGSTINTDNGTVMSGNSAVAVASVTVAQSGGAMLRVLMAKSWSIGDVRVSGSLPLAIVASGEITIRGVLDASADGPVSGPGARSCGTTGAGGAPGPGFYSQGPANSGGYPKYLWHINGAGGGGFGTAGGDGGVRTTGYPVGAGGIVNGEPTLVPLRGGCSGYGAIASYLGGGGGAVQLVSNKSVHLVDGGNQKGAIHVGGGGGHSGDLGKADTNDPTLQYGPAGGGAGGGILIEAPVVTLDDGTALLAAGGGGGGYGACSPVPNGLDALANGGTPTGGACPGGTTPVSIGGNGGTTTAGTTGGDTSNGGAGGGGGGIGRIRVNTADGQYASGTGALVRGSATTGTVGTR